MNAPSRSPCSGPPGSLRARDARRIAIAGVALLWILANALPLNFVFAGTVLYGWKQFAALLLLGGLFLAGGRAAAQRGRMERRMVRWVRIAVLGVVALSARTLLVGLSPMRIAYAAIAYVGFCGFVLLPGLAGAGRWQKGFVGSIALLGVFCGFGLVFDYFFNVFDVLVKATGGVPQYQEWAERYEGAFRRATFLFESPSNIFPLLSLSMVCLAILGEGARSRSERILYPLCIVPVVLGIFLTQTRAQWVLAAVMVAGIVLARSRRGLRGLARRLAVAGVLVVATVLLVRATALKGDQGEEIMDRMTVGLSLATEENEFRTQAWREGLAMFADPSAAWLTGYGLGTTIAQIDDGNPVESHFESSLLQSFYEGGAGGLLLRLWMPAAVLLALRRNRTGGGARGRILKLWVACYLAAIAAAPSAGAYHAQAAVAIVLGMACMGKRWWAPVEAPVPERPLPRLAAGARARGIGRIPDPGRGGPAWDAPG